MFAHSKLVLECFGTLRESQGVCVRAAAVRSYISSELNNSNNNNHRSMILPPTADTIT